MPNAQHARWFLVYLAPFDGYRFKHAKVFNSLDDEMYMRQTVLPAHNPDWKVVSLERVPSDGEAAEELLRDRIAALHGQGEGYRVPQGSEEMMTRKHVAKKEAELAKLRDLQDTDGDGIPDDVDPTPNG